MISHGGVTLTSFPFPISDRLNQLLSRRQFLKLGGVSVIGVSALGSLLSQGETNTPLIILEQAKGIIIADPTL
jgi:hypothetical protein